MDKINLFLESYKGIMISNDFFYNVGIIVFLYILSDNYAKFKINNNMLIISNRVKYHLSLIILVILNYTILRSIVFLNKIDIKFYLIVILVVAGYILFILVSNSLISLINKLGRSPTICVKNKLEDIGKNLTHFIFSANATLLIYFIIIPTIILISDMSAIIKFIIIVILILFMIIFVVSSSLYKSLSSKN